MCNVMFDMKATRPVHAKLNSVISEQNMIFYAATTLTHVTALSYLSFFFRFRRLGKVPVLAIGTAYYCAFENINNILYKVLVDRHVL